LIILTAVQQLSAPSFREYVFQCIYSDTIRDTSTFPAQILGKDNKFVEVTVCVSAIKDPVGVPMVFVANVLLRSISMTPISWNKDRFIQFREVLFSEFKRKAEALDNTAGRDLFDK
jgi:hypothetical protein